MREILFRGKQTANGEWVYGNFLQWYGFVTLIDEGLVDKKPVKVDHSTVGQYIGLKDKDGNSIFEGDVVSVFLHHVKGTIKGFIAFEDCGWVLRFPDGSYSCIDPSDDGRWTVVGNIHDNPDLLEVE